MESKRILLVAEDRENLPLVTFLLRLGSYSVTTVQRLDEALNWLQLTSSAHPFELLVIDPVPGTSTLGRATALAALGKIPVLLIQRETSDIRPRRGAFSYSGQFFSCPPETILEEMERFFLRKEVIEAPNRYRDGISSGAI